MVDAGIHTGDGTTAAIVWCADPEGRNLSAASTAVDTTDRTWSLQWRSHWIPNGSATPRLRELRGQCAGQHKLIEDVVQLILVWVVHRRGENKQLRLHCEVSDQLKVIVVRCYEVIVGKDV